MGYKERIHEANEDVRERYELIMDRVLLIRTEHAVPDQFWDYFRKTADFLKQIDQVVRQVETGAMYDRSIEECEETNWNFYYEILPGNYDRSYANPEVAVRLLGEEFGSILCFLYTELRSLIGFAFEGRKRDITIYTELFVEIYNCFESETGTSYDEIQDIIRWFFHDYSEIFSEEKIGEMVDPEYDFYTSILKEADLNDLRYLYRYGEYITTSEMNTATFLNQFSEEEIQSMADTMTEGFYTGYQALGKDLSKKSTIALIYPVGFERVAAAAVRNIEAKGLKTTISRNNTSSFFVTGRRSYGCYTKPVNHQFEFDHRNDKFFYLDKAFVERRLETLKSAFELYRIESRGHAGPAVIEIFGEAPFAPSNKKEAPAYSKEQNELNVSYQSRAAELTNMYIPDEERSFTIIAYPIPVIGNNFEEIFRETVKINTLDYMIYRTIQQKLIDVLDAADSVVVKGAGKNRTDLTISLYPLTDAEKETKFENCVADVNIPVGEVFTSPVLKGTNGTLHVTQVFLNGLKYLDLELLFADGIIVEYNCSNFASEKENKQFIFENLLNRHESLPIGEFAIGTNTTAYKMAKTYQIADKLPILIAEKMGPHFAVGDTCYSHAEEIKVFNPDGKEIVARENEISAKRNVDSKDAYFNCHTDITIPYDELSSIHAITSAGDMIPIIEEGKFAVPGTEELNGPLE